MPRLRCRFERRQEHPPERPAEFGVGDRRGADEIDRTADVVVEQPRDRAYLVGQRDPTPVLLAVAEAAAETQFEWQ